MLCIRQDCLIFIGQPSYGRVRLFIGTHHHHSWVRDHAVDDRLRAADRVTSKGTSLLANGGMGRSAADLAHPDMVDNVRITEL